MNTLAREDFIAALPDFPATAKRVAFAARLYRCRMKLLQHVRRKARAKRAARQRARREERRAEARRASALTDEQRLREVFDLIDEDGNGTLDAAELELAFKRLGNPVTPAYAQVRARARERVCSCSPAPSSKEFPLSDTAG